MTVTGIGVSAGQLLPLFGWLTTLTIGAEFGGNCAITGGIMVVVTTKKVIITMRIDETMHEPIHNFERLDFISIPLFLMT